MTKDRLFLVQDPDGDMWVAARDWREAVDRWRLHVCSELDPEEARGTDPSGVQLVAEEEDFLPRENP